MHTYEYASGILFTVLFLKAHVANGMETSKVNYGTYVQWIEYYEVIKMVIMKLIATQKHGYDCKLVCIL
jgi:hypothetical protein